MRYNQQGILEDEGERGVGDDQDEEMETVVVVTGSELDEIRCSSASASSGWIPLSLQITPWSELLVKYAEHEILTAEKEVKITFPNGEVVPILAQIAAWKCTYFRQLFTDNREAIRQELQRNLIQNISPSVFKMFLLYLYQGKLKKGLSPEELRQMIELAVMYKPKRLLKLCSKAIKDSINVESVFHILKTAEMFQLNEIAQLALQLALEWGETKSKEQLFLEDSLERLLLDQLHNIRFPIMSISEIGEFVHQTGLLEDHELLQIYHYLSNPNRNEEIDMVGRFSARKRNQKDISVGKTDNDFEMNDSEIPEDDSYSEMCTNIINIRSLEDVAETENIHEVKTSFVVNNPSSYIISSSVASDEASFPGNSENPSTSERIVVSIAAFAADNFETAEFVPKKQVTFEEMDDVDSSDSNEDLFEKVQNLKDLEFETWDSYVNRWKNTKNLETLKKIELKNIRIKSFYPKVVLPQINSCIIDLQIDFPKHPDPISFSRFETTFDVRRFMFFQKNPEKPWRMDDLWDNDVPIQVTINGVTFLKINKSENLLTLSYPLDADEIFSGLGKKDKLYTLSLLKTPLPVNPSHFPRKSLKELTLYSVRLRDTEELGRFLQRCTSLNTLRFSCSTTDETPETQQPSCIDMQNHVKATSLETMTLFNTCLHYVLLKDSPHVVKSSISALYLDQCCWTPTIVDSFDTMFPNLTSFGFRQREADNDFSKSRNPDIARWHVTHHVSANLNARLFNKLIKIKSIRSIRIFGKDSSWLEEGDAFPANCQNQSPLKAHVTPRKYNSIKNLACDESVTPSPTRALRRRTNDSELVSSDEIKQAQNFLESCGLSRTVYNFKLEAEENGSVGINGTVWKGVEYNEKESKKRDDGFWDFMEQLEFEIYDLGKFYRDVETFDRYFSEPVEDDIE